jgi:RNA polymerase subunit RPABC4/transcription elongation factor Spt4
MYELSNVNDCPSCGTIIPASQNFCAVCGTQMNMNCPKCETLQSIYNNNCTHCGEKLRADEVIVLKQSSEIVNEKSIKAPKVNQFAKIFNKAKSGIVDLAASLKAKPLAEGQSTQKSEKPKKGK